MKPFRMKKVKEGNRVIEFDVIDIISKDIYTKQEFGLNKHLYVYDYIVIGDFKHVTIFDDEDLQNVISYYEFVDYI